jgi:hypothetical protein
VVFRFPSGHLVGVPEPLPITFRDYTPKYNTFGGIPLTAEDPDYLRAWERVSPSYSWLGLQQDARWEKIKPMEWEILYNYTSQDMLKFVQGLLLGGVMRYAHSPGLQGGTDKPLPSPWSRGQGWVTRNPDPIREEQFHRHLRATLKHNTILPSLVRIELSGGKPNQYFLSPIELKAWNERQSKMDPKTLRQLYPHIVFIEDRNGRRKIADQANIPEGAGIERAHAILDPFYYTFAHLYGGQVLDAAFQDENQ